MRRLNRISTAMDKTTGATKSARRMTVLSSLARGRRLSESWLTAGDTGKAFPVHKLASELERLWNESGFPEAEVELVADLWTALVHVNGVVFPLSPALSKEWMLVNNRHEDAVLQKTTGRKEKF